VSLPREQQRLADDADLAEALLAYMLLRLGRLARLLEADKAVLDGV
jgi:hypothetical protein